MSAVHWDPINRQGAQCGELAKPLLIPATESACSFHCVCLLLSVHCVCVLLSDSWLFYCSALLPATAAACPGVPCPRLQPTEPPHNGARVTALQCMWHPPVWAPAAASVSTVLTCRQQPLAASAAECKHTTCCDPNSQQPPHSCWQCSVCTSSSRRVWQSTGAAVPSIRRLGSAAGCAQQQRQHRGCSAAQPSQRWWLGCTAARCWPQQEQRQPLRPYCAVAQHCRAATLLQPARLCSCRHACCCRHCCCG
jgi:hypothetical protein